MNSKKKKFFSLIFKEQKTCVIFFNKFVKKENDYFFIKENIQKKNLKTIKNLKN